MFKHPRRFLSPLVWSVAAFVLAAVVTSFGFGDGLPLDFVPALAQEEDNHTYLPVISNSKPTPNQTSDEPAHPTVTQTVAHETTTPKATSPGQTPSPTQSRTTPVETPSPVHTFTPTKTATSNETATSESTPTAQTTPTAQPTKPTQPTKSSTSTTTPALTVTATLVATANATPTPVGTQVANGGFIVLGWNDLGMHCYNSDFQDLAVLPPFNTLWAQVIKRGDPPQIVTDTVKINYSFPDNTDSVSKVNFWEYDQQLFGVDLPPNVGLAGKGLAGEMDPVKTHFVAEGIPLTEFSDSNPTQSDPYQLAEMAVIALNGMRLTSSTVVAPVSSEMHCDNCHHDGGVENIRTGSVAQNILTLHDKENAEEYPPGHTGKLMDRRPVLCAECHSSNALGAPGVSGIPSLSNAIHEKHAGKVQNSTEGCYNCHPGPSTKCLRDVMSSKFQMGCTDCHGNMEKVANNPNPWLNEPRCDSCHTDPKYAQNNPLFRMSTGHGGVYCEGCHDSTHAIAPSSQAQNRDAIKFIQLQGHGGPIDTCSVCHTTAQSAKSPHDINTSQ